MHIGIKKNACEQYLINTKQLSDIGRYKKYFADVEHNLIYTQPIYTTLHDKAHAHNN